MTRPMVVLLSRHASPDASQAALESDLRERLISDPRYVCAETSPLYDLTRDDAIAEALRARRDDWVLLTWLYDRAAYWLLRQLGVSARHGATEAEGIARAEGPDGATDGGSPVVWCLDLKEHSTGDSVVAALETFRGKIASRSDDGETSATFTQAMAIPAERRRWYPVVDLDRCSHCLECLNFCLFGVFGVRDDGRILIEQPDACRHGCPACSRICPVGAIMFPAHDDPAIAGDASRPPGDLKLDLSQIFGGLGASDSHRRAAAERDAALRAARDVESTGDGESTEDNVSDALLDRWVDALDDADLD